MVKESQFMKAELRRLKKSLSEKTSLETEYEAYQADILSLNQLRKTLSDALQQWLFSQFHMQNHEGESKDLLEIFRDAALRDYPQATIATSRIAALKMVPPAGSGECCEPKLLQYAYQHGYKPLQMAMFWWGESPKEEIRHHLQFYPACNGKCKPILHWMLPDSVFHSQIAEKAYFGNLIRRRPAGSYLQAIGIAVCARQRFIPAIRLFHHAEEISGGKQSVDSPPSRYGNKRSDDYRQNGICLSSSAERVSAPSGSEEIHRHHWM